MTADKISFRPMGPDDMDLSYRVYADSRYDIEALDWSDQEKTEFLRMQFNAQHQHYQNYYGDSEFLIIAVDGQDAGRLYIERREDEILIVDIALLKAFRRRGVGSSILKDIQAEAAQAALPVRIHVEKNNPALGLYYRLGFVVIGDEEVYWYLEWTPKKEEEQ